MRKPIAPRCPVASPTLLAPLDAVAGGFGATPKPSFTPPHPGPPTAIRYEEGKRYDWRRRKNVPTLTYEETTGAPKPIPEGKQDQPGFGLFD
jgi:hypothetical protein